MSDNMFLNMPVEGEVYVSSDRSVPQKSEEEVNSLFAAVIGQRGVDGVAWAQYTPYFNDGEPCVFGVGEPYVALTDANHNAGSHYFDYGWQEDDYEETGRVWCGSYDSEFKRLVGECKASYEGQWPNGKSVYEDKPANPVLYYPIMALFRAVGSGSCNDVLLRKFGDHAIVVVDTKNNKVVVETYDHD